MWDMKPVTIFFMAGGVIFLLLALFLRSMDSETANTVGLTFGIIGLCWLVPQVFIHLARRDH
jgi:uncharacterized membrane protein YhaH (DUF805 family)